MDSAILSSWLRLRRVRVAIVALVALLLFGGLSFQYPDLHTRVREYAHDATASASTKCDYSTSEEIDDSRVTEDSESLMEPSVQWSSFAYVQYVTDPTYLCNSLMVFEALRRYNTKADLLMMYPEQWKVPDAASNDGLELLAQARDEYKVHLVPVQVKRFENEKDPTWQDSYTKLLAFNQTQYKRVISIDSDGTVQNHMDELFLLPSAPVAMPRAYWMDKFFLSSQLIVIEPSDTEWKRVEHAMNHHEGNDYDMDILNKVYGSSSTVIPHRRYDLLTGEFHKGKHENYLGSPTEEWDPRKALEEAKFIHFSDWPMPKPWIEPNPNMLESHQPKCGKTSPGGGELDCADREVWLGIRKDFRERRLRICGREYDRHQKRDVFDTVSLRPWYEPVFD